LKWTTLPRRPSWLAGVLSLAIGCPGCGGPAASDPAEGRTALLAVLDAWKGGDSPDALAKRSPPIRVSDGDWMAGLRLQGYRATDEGKLVGSDVNYSVALELKNARGKVSKKTAVYAVTTRPQLMVLRQND
jgi:hypothetical protein